MHILWQRRDELGRGERAGGISGQVVDRPGGGEGLVFGLMATQPIWANSSHVVSSDLHLLNLLDLRSP